MTTNTFFFIINLTKPDLQRKELVAPTLATITCKRKELERSKNYRCICAHAHATETHRKRVSQPLQIKR
jgi:hypothetical protein